MNKNQFLNLGFLHALHLAETAEDYEIGTNFGRTTLWAKIKDDKTFLVQYEGVGYMPMSVQLCGTQAVLYPGD